MKVSKMAANLIGSEIIKLAGQIKEKIRNGETIYNLTIGDFNTELFPIPAALEADIKDAYTQGHTNYPGASGIIELREAVSTYISKYEGLDYSADECLISCGARPLIFATYMSIIDPGDKVIYPLPSWNNNHYSHINSAAAIPVQTTPEENFMPTAELLAPHVKGATLIALCSPLNPTGTTFSREQLSGICELVIAENKRRGPDQKPLYLMYDQIYWQLTYGETTHLNPVSLYPEMRDYTIFIDGLSKAFSATGVRVGWAMGPSHVINKMRSINSHLGAWAPKAEQAATAKYLGRGAEVETFLTEIKGKLHQRLNGFYEGFQQLKSKGYAVDAIAPQAAIYLTVRFDLKGKRTADGRVLETHGEVHQYILNESRLAIVPFYAFGTSKDSPWYRLSVGTARIEDLPTIFELLDKALSKLS